MHDVLSRIRLIASQERVRLTAHAQAEMLEEDISLDALLQAIGSGTILENYPEHRRGPCCLVCGRDNRDRPLHIVCTSTLPVLVIITVYEPRPPKWISPTERRKWA